MADRAVIREKYLNGRAGGSTKRPSIMNSNSKDNDMSSIFANTFNSNSGFYNHLDNVSVNRNNISPYMDDSQNKFNMTSTTHHFNTLGGGNINFEHEINQRKLIKQKQALFERVDRNYNKVKERGQPPKYIFKEIDGINQGSEDAMSS